MEQQSHRLQLDCFPASYRTGDPACNPTLPDSLGQPSSQTLCNRKSSQTGAKKSQKAQRQLSTARCLKAQLENSSFESEDQKARSSSGSERGGGKEGRSLEINLEKEVRSILQDSDVGSRASQISTPKRHLPRLPPDHWSRIANRQVTYRTILSECHSFKNEEELSSFDGQRKEALTLQTMLPSMVYFVEVASPGKKRCSIGKEQQRQFLIDELRVQEDGRTTVMIKNIPNKYSSQMLIEEIDLTHKQQYDFFYLPIDFKNNCNVGYAFINFVRPLDIVSFLAKFAGRKWTCFNSQKICELRYARIQGRQALVNHFHNSTVMQHKKFRPHIKNRS